MASRFRVPCSVAGNIMELRKSSLQSRRILLKNAVILGLSSAVGYASTTQRLIAQDRTVSTEAASAIYLLNLIYMRSEYYLRSLTGSGLPDNRIVGRGMTGAVSGGSKVSFYTTVVKQYVSDFSQDASNAVTSLRSLLGDGVIGRPAIDFSTGFNELSKFSGVSIVANPFSSEEGFLLGSFFLEDVIASAFAGIYPDHPQDDKSKLVAAIAALQNYQYGIIRRVLFSRGSFSQTAPIARYLAQTDNKITMKIELGSSGKLNLYPIDENNKPIARTQSRIIEILSLGDKNQAGAFIPNGFNIV